MAAATNDPRNQAQSEDSRRKSGELTRTQWFWLVLFGLLAVVSVVFCVWSFYAAANGQGQLALSSAPANTSTPSAIDTSEDGKDPSLAFLYVALTLVPASISGALLISLESRVHRQRRVDSSEVESLFVDVDTLASLRTPQHLTNRVFRLKKEEIENERKRLRKIGWKQWTEYQILPLRQMLAELRHEHELRVEAQSALDDLEDYALDSAVSYDIAMYQKWNSRIEGIFTRLDECTSPKKRIEHLRGLNAQVKQLYDHVADYERRWSEGSVYLQTATVIAISWTLFLLLMGLIPEIHRNGDGVLSILHWGLLGMAGALGGALFSIRRADVVEVGNTHARRELQRFVLGAGIGLLSGVVTYAAMYGGLLSVPLLDSPPRNGLAIFWAIAAGYGFRQVFGWLERSVDRNL